MSFKSSSIVTLEEQAPQQSLSHPHNFQLCFKIPCYKNILLSAFIPQQGEPLAPKYCFKNKLKLN